MVGCKGCVVGICGITDCGVVSCGLDTDNCPCCCIFRLCRLVRFNGIVIIRRRFFGGSFSSQTTRSIMSNSYKFLSPIGDYQSLKMRLKSLNQRKSNNLFGENNLFGRDSQTETKREKENLQKSGLLVFSINRTSL